jgi:hypothetical protein
MHSPNHLHYPCFQDGLRAGMSEGQERALQAAFNERYASAAKVTHQLAQHRGILTWVDKLVLNSVEFFGTSFAQLFRFSNRYRLLVYQFESSIHFLRCIFIMQIYNNVLSMLQFYNSVWHNSIITRVFLASYTALFLDITCWIRNRQKPLQRRRK